ncbi:MAG TPA: trypsin-like peptidase domain-containing protein [Streptosporangiaceae bacterium]|nr:trypsin-like peptidase domain-containing protein [Streptosporangiaceae bacterium]
MSERPGHGDVGADGTSGHGFSPIPPIPAVPAIPAVPPIPAVPASPPGDSEGERLADLLPSSGPAGSNADGATDLGGASLAYAGGSNERTSDFGKFDWFAQLDDFGRAGRTADGHAGDCHQTAPSAPATDNPCAAGGQAAGDKAVLGQAAGGLPAGAVAAEGSSGKSDDDKRRWWQRRTRKQWGERQRSYARRDEGRADGWLSDKKKEAGLRGMLRGWRLAVAVFGLATACTLLGGVLGGFVVLHSERSGLSDSSYSLGAVPSASTSRPASSVAGIAARDLPGVVMIKVNNGQGTGSGFLIQGGYIVTDNHVVTLDGLLTDASLRVYFSDGRSARGVLVGRDPYSDIAVLKVAGIANLPALTLGSSKAVAVGDPVIAIGSPLGLADTVTSGIVSAVDRPVQPSATGGHATTQVFFDAIQTDAPINPGNSGGPLVNARGQVIGVDAAIDTLGNDPITGSQGGSIGLGFAIPMDQARRVIEQLIRTGHATHSVMGAAINENFDGNGAQIASTRGAVAPGGPAARAGLEPGDVVIRVGSLPISNPYGLMDAIRSQAPGSRVTLTFLRHSQTHQTELKLGSASA